MPTENVRLLNQKQEFSGYVSRDTVNVYLEVKRRLERAAGIAPVKLLLVSGDSPNAFAGYVQGQAVIGFNLPMIRVLGSDADAIAAIMGHEIAHLKLRHGDVRQQREQLRTGMSTILGLALGFAGIPLGGTIADLGTQVVATAYTRDEERDADKAGREYMEAAGFDVAGAPRAFERIAAIDKSISIPFLATHPLLSERITTAKTAADTAPATRSASASSPGRFTLWGVDFEMKESALVVSSVAPSASTSLQSGDRLLRCAYVGSRALRSETEIKSCNAYPGRPLTLMVDRSGAEMYATIEVVEQQESPPRPRVSLPQ
jgi:hypothetical protein